MQEAAAQWFDEGLQEDRGEVPVKTIYGSEESGVNVIEYGFNILGLIFSQIFYRIRVKLFGKKETEVKKQARL